MRNRIVIVLCILGLAAIAAHARAQRAQAIQAFIAKAKSDCASIEAHVTLLYSEDDLPNDEENRDFFSLVIIDQDTDTFLEQAPESITDEQTPYYWMTGRIETAALNGVYNLELWDTGADGELDDRYESFVYDCKDRSFYYDTDEHAVNEAIPEYTCQTSVPVYTTNYAPEDGALMITWSYDGQDSQDQDWHVETVRIDEGDALTGETFPVPCYAWVKLYFQPDSTKQIYLMPSQYWPHGAFGAGAEDNGLDININHTFFPLDGPIRAEELPVNQGGGD
ncbi:MAG: hypothetical protein ACFB51_11785 [Anaerolineae bacterium]